MLADDHLPYLPDRMVAASRAQASIGRRRRRREERLAAWGSEERCYIHAAKNVPLKPILKWAHVIGTEPFACR